MDTVIHQPAPILIAPSHAAHRRRGMSLIELMVAMAIVTFGLLTILGLFTATLLTAQRTEIDMVTDIAYSHGVQATDLPEFLPPFLLGNVAPPLPIPAGDAFSYADEPNGVIRGVSGDYAVAVEMNNHTIAITQWFSQRPAPPPAPLPAPQPVLLPGETGLRYVTIHTGQIPSRGFYGGAPAQGEVLNEFVLVGVCADANDN